MFYEELKGDLFAAECKIPSDAYRYVQCISADCKCGAGIAIEFNKHFNIRDRIPYGLKFARQMGSHTMKMLPCPSIYDTIPVINLITKERYYDKPTYKTMEQVFKMLRSWCDETGISDLYLPKIASGLDGLKWVKVTNRLQWAFRDSDIKLHVFYL